MFSNDVHGTAGNPGFRGHDAEGADRGPAADGPGRVVDPRQRAHRVGRRGSEGRGSVTKTDIVAGLSDAIDPDETHASALMSTPLVSVGPDETLQSALNTMSEQDVKRVLVERDGDLIGILTTTDVREELSPDLGRIVGMFVDD